jgi:hypothetical protein
MESRISLTAQGKVKTEMFELLANNLETLLEYIYICPQYVRRVGEMRKWVQNFRRKNAKLRDQVGDLSAGRIILKCILKKRREVVEWIHLALYGVQKRGLVNTDNLQDPSQQLLASEGLCPWS